ncbi:hypothetical protein [Flagellimonas lutimaris]|nr:hypothetical protein [Allomuricauda lutimaris]
MASSLPYLAQWVNYPGDGTFDYVIANQGVGPAFIQEVFFEILAPSGKDTLTFKNSDQLFRRLIKNKKLKSLTSTFRKGMLLPANSSKTLIHVIFQDDDSDASFMKTIQDTLLGYRIYYEDVYGNKWYIKNESESPVKVPMQH